MSNNLRTRNGMPFNFVNGLKVRGMDIESLIPGIEGIPEAGSKYQFAGNGTNKSFTLPVSPYNKDAVDVYVKQLYVHPDDYALVGDTVTLVEAPPAVVAGETYNVVIKVSLTTLNGYVNANRVSFEGENLDDILEKGKPLANYSNLRAYAGAATQVRITDPGIAGFFYYDASDTSSVDNDGTVIVSNNGRRWKRLSKSMVNLKWFGAVGDGVADDTAALKKWLLYRGAKWLGEGHFRITEPITIPGGQGSGTAQNFVGAGVNLTSIYADNASGAFTNNAIIKTDPATDNYYHVFKNFSITSNSASNRIDTGFAIVRCLQCTFENIGLVANGKALHSVYGIVVEGTYSCTMRGLWLNADITYVNFLVGRTCLDMIIDLLYTSNFSDYHIIADRSIRKYSTDNAAGTQRIIFNTPTMQGARKYAIWIADYDELVFTNMYHENVVSCLKIGKDQAVNGFCRDIVFRDCDFFDTPVTGMAQRHTLYMGGKTQIGTKPVNILFDHCLFENSSIIFGAGSPNQITFQNPHFYGGTDINVWQAKFLFRSGAMVESTDFLLLPMSVMAHNFAGVSSPATPNAYKGTWDASSNTPTLSSSLPTGLAHGWYYLVSTGASRNINSWFGTEIFEPGDCVVFDGSQWVKQEDIQGAVFKGTWDASSNTPTLGNGLPTGVSNNDEYFVNVAGTQTINPTVGAVVFAIGDYVKYDSTQGGWVQVKMSTLSNIKARIAGITHSVNVGTTPTVNQTIRFYTPKRTFVDPN